MKATPQPLEPPHKSGKGGLKQKGKSNPRRGEVELAE